MDIKDRIVHQFPEFIATEYPGLVEFAEHYYQFLDSSELVLSSISGTFVKTEVISVGATGFTSTVRSVDTAKSRLFISTQNKFVIGETVTGATSGATGVIVTLTPNPIQSIENLLDYRDIDKTVDTFFKHFKSEFLASIPNKLTSSVNKRNITKNIVDLYRAKGTSEGHKLFFRMLLDEDVELYYPAEDLLAPSDGDWSFDKIMRVLKGSVLTDQDVLVGSTVLQKNDVTSSTINKATCSIDSVKTFLSGATEVLEFSIAKENIVGDFVVGETLYIVGSNSVTYTFTSTGIISTITFTDPGEHYSAGDVITTAGFTYPAILNVANVSSGSIPSVEVITEGTAYTGTESLVFDSTGTGGQGVVGVVSGVHGGIDLETNTGPGELVQEDHTVFVSGIPESSLLLDSGTGKLAYTRMTNTGFNYSKIPTVSAVTSGTAAVLVPTTLNVGGITHLDIYDPGFTISGTVSLTPDTVLIVKTASSNYVVGETVTSSSGATGIVRSFESSINLLKLRNISGTFAVGNTLTGGTSTTTSTLLRNTTASIAVETGVLSNGIGRFITEDGWVSSYAKRIQDNYYYQKFSYLVKAAESIVNWRAAVKKAVHPAGFAMFGEIKLVSLLSVGMKIPTADTQTYTPELFSTFKEIFGPVLRRRLGSSGNGTINPTPNVGGIGLRSAAEQDYDVSMSYNVDIDLSIKTGPFPGRSTYVLEKYKFYNPPSNPVLTASGPLNWVHTNLAPDIGTHNAFYIRDWSTYKISDISKTVRSNVPPLSEISLKDTS